MECPICEHRQRKFICQACVRTHVRELRAQISKAGDERQVEVEKAAKLLGSGVEKERWARAERYALEANITAVKGELEARRVANQKAKENVEAKRRVLTERRDNLKLARDFLPSPASPSHTTSPISTAGLSQDNTIISSTSHSLPSTTSRLSRLFPFPSSSAVAPSSPPPPRRHKPPNPLTEAKQALSNVADALSEGRAALVRELAEAYELQEECRVGQAGQEEYIWTLGRMELPSADDLSRFKPSLLHTTLYNTLHFMRLTSFYLGVKLPFEIGWGASSTIYPPFPSLFIPGAAEGAKLETISEDGAEPSGSTPVGVGTPWIVAGRGLGGTGDGGWAKYTTPLALHLPAPTSAPIKNGGNLQPAPTSKPPRPANASPGKRRPSLLSLSRVSAAARYVAGSAYSTPRSPHSNTISTGLPTRSSTSPSPRPRQRAGSVSMQTAPQIRARVASLATMPTLSSLRQEQAGEEPIVQTPIQSFVAALTMVQYNAAYLAWTQGALDVGKAESLPGILGLLGATVVSGGIGYASHNTSAAQDHALPPPTRSFPLSFPALLGYNLGLIGGLGSAGLPSHDGDGEWDLVEASEEEDGVG
ncbi:hypothetical protein RSOLAG1IB_10552 [Rhizoctonia solani AG-1 IB]|uniref:Autophagy-related protein 14 n=1 Tax=Thanatephorus cucumeris (strain AG1-IB / isolate 7/3/14) TaxID=1108050 RepID=A0A0B7G1A9_THACB|nr:hypothetical protein RSOLAG1IB_10552 [Rhizoctonia solani AG-1 IB]